MNSAHIRKQVYELAPQDLERFAVWEFALDEEDEEGQDEATVRPYEPNGRLDPSDGMFIVRARLQLADGTRMLGYLTPANHAEVDLGTVQPSIVTQDGQVSFWCGVITPEPAQLAACYARLGKFSPGEVFPIRFQADVDIVGGPIEGEVPGFMVLEDFKASEARVIR